MIAQLGKYEIRRELARGAMGVVYEGYDPLIKRRVALKTIRPDQLDGERTADVIARFRREAQAAGRLSHPNIVAIYDFDDDAGTSFIAMEFVDGRELKECFAADERFRMPDIERIMTELLDALAYSHARGVVHRDIKPANIFLLADGTVKVADFGIAHIESSNLTQAGTVVGTPNYMSPEQIMGLPVDARADLFAAGVILYQFLTGERPFAGSMTTTMQKVLKEEPLPPSTLNVQLPPAIDAVVRKALAKRADERFQTAGEFSLALRAAMRASAAVSVDADATMPNLAAIDARMAVARPANVGGDPATTPVPAPRNSQTAAIVIVAVIGVIGIGALASAWWMFARGPTNPVAEAKPAAAPVVAAAAPAVVAVAMPMGSVATPATNGAPTLAAVNAPSTPRPAAAPPAQPGTLLITAVGLADPSSARYANDRAQLEADVRADSKGQLVEKAVMLLLDRQSFVSHYDLLQSRLLSQSGSFIRAVVQESAPAIGKDGLMSVTTQALVNVEAIRQSLDRMSRDDRVQLIRASGDPRIAVRITVRDEAAANAPPEPSAIAENVLKERIHAFGFRTWTEASDVPGAAHADFVVSGEARVRRLSTRLAASGLVITKYALASWTVKCTDRATGEEIYFNTTLPKGGGSAASQEGALRAIGAGVADQFSREFFLQHVPLRGRTITLAVAGMPDAATGALLTQELIGLPAVIGARADASTKPPTYAIEIAAGTGSDAIVNDILQPLNAKLGEACFSAGASEGERVSVVLDQRCAAGLRARLESNPPAALYGAPAARRKAVISNPDTLRKLLV